MIIKTNNKVLTVLDCLPEDDAFERLFDPFFKERWMNENDCFILFTEESRLRKL